MSNEEMAPEVTAPGGGAASEEPEIDPEEYDMLDAKLDDLNTVLDVIEQKNDRIRDEFAKLLQSNREIREELKRQMDCDDGDSADPPPPPPPQPQSNP